MELVVSHPGCVVTPASPVRHPREGEAEHSYSLCCHFGVPFDRSLKCAIVQSVTVTAVTCSH